MGMFDEKRYLTGANGEFNVGDVFRLHSAVLGDTVTINRQERLEAVLEVDRGDGAAFVVFTSGQGIVNQVKRIDSTDDFPRWVKLVEQSTGKAGQNAMHLLEPAESPG